MADITRQEEIRGIQNEYKWLYQLLGGIALLVLGIFLGIKIGEAEFYDRQRDYQMNLWTEAVGVIASIGLTVFILDRMSERRESIRRQEQLKRDLVRDAGSRVNQTAVNAVEQLRHKGWLMDEDGLLKGADLWEANLQGAVLWRANLQQVTFHRAILMEANLIESNLQKADLQGATLHKASMQNSNLLQANLGSADVRGAHLHDTILRNANLNAVNLSGAVLFRANLQGASLVWANLLGANFQAADMRRTNLHGADLSDANLYAVYLEGATLSGEIKLDGATLPDGTEYNDEADMARFTDRAHPRFDETLEIINAIRRKSGYDIS